jgi:hypothetical protein
LTSLLIVSIVKILVWFLNYPVTVIDVVYVVVTSYLVAKVVAVVVERFFLDFAGFFNGFLFLGLLAIEETVLDGRIGSDPIAFTQKLIKDIVPSPTIRLINSKHSPQYPLSFL